MADKVLEGSLRMGAA